MSVEMLAKSAFDPGSSMLHHDLLSVDEGQAQFSVAIPQNVKELTVERVFINLKKQYDAIFIGYAPGGKYREMVVNPDFSASLNSSDILFYIANRRIAHMDWAALGEA